MKKRAQRIYRFAEFTLETENRRLSRNGTRVAIQDKPLDALIALVSKGGELVTREALAEALWQPGIFVDADSGLNTAIRKLREVLRDSPSQPRFVETVPRHGYRFLAPIDADEVVSTVVPNGGSRRRTLGWMSPRAIVCLGLAIALVVLIAAGTFFVRTQRLEASELGETERRPMVDSAAPERPVLQCADETSVRMAVVSFRVDSDADERSGRLVAALTDDVIGALWEQGDNGMRLVARQVNALTDVTPSDSDVVLAGQVLLRGDEIELTVRLLEPETQGTVWQRTFVTPENEPYLLRSKVASTVSSFLAGAMS